MDIFDRKAIKPMLIADMAPAFDSPDWIYEIKLDGIRCLAYLNDSQTDLRNKRDKKLLPHVPELSQINKQVTTKCILDGELFILKNGITDFYEIQRRVLLNDPLKIQVAAGKYPASFVAYDIIYNKNELVTELPLMDRKELLQKTVMENKYISVSRYVEQYGITLYDLAKKSGLEGIVGKKRESKYYFDKRTKDWVKCKVMATDDCVICGYIRKENNMTSLVLGQYKDDMLVYRGHVTMGVSMNSLREHNIKELPFSPFGYVPKGNDDAIWVEPNLVCIVESMPTEKESFRQPVFKGIRDDKLPKECKVMTYAH